MCDEMTEFTEDFLADVAHQIQQSIAGQVRIDNTARLLYSSDASIYQIEPYGVIFPRIADDLNAIVEVCSQAHTPLIVRGAGSGLTGGAIGRGWIVDCSRYLNQLLEIDPEARTAVVAPGVVLNRLNREAARFGLQFGPDPASAERATLGGSMANNASGAHSICYGMCADHLLGVEVALSDASTAMLEEVALSDASRRFAAHSHREALLYQAALTIREKHAAAIRSGWPRPWRRASGYNLNYLLPWSPTQPPRWTMQAEWGGVLGDGILPYPPVFANTLNLAPLIAGSEGTLAVIRKAKVRLSPLPKHTILAVLTYPTIAAACDAVPEILETAPSAVELIPQNLVRLARTVPAYASQLALLSPIFAGGQEPPAMLAVEYSASDVGEMLKGIQQLPADRLALIADTAAKQRQVWNIRKVGLGLFLSRAGDAKPWSFIEDVTVPVERLGDFVRELERLMTAYGVEAENYGHASAGCLHLRPVINLKSLHGVETMRHLASDVLDLVIRLNGALSGEHGDGISRTEWNARLFGKEIMQAFSLLKRAADPAGILNPGKIAPLTEGGDLPLMDENLRFGEGYHASTWEAEFAYPQQGSLSDAIELCNGAGVCRKAEGVMCPSFQATQDETYSTRGRANLLRSLISGRLLDAQTAEKAAWDALDLCLACKGCKAECPSTVDMAKLKYEYLSHYYVSHPRKLRDYLFGYIAVVARLAQRFTWLANPILGCSLGGWLGERLFGLSGHRSLPQLAPRSLSAMSRAEVGAHPNFSGHTEAVLFLSDAFTEYFFPEVGLAAIRTLSAAGCRVIPLPVLGAGRTLISKGFLKQARQHAQRLLAAVQRLDPEGQMYVVGVEPSEMLTLSDEYPDLFPNNAAVASLARRAYNIEEFLVRPSKINPNKLRIANIHTNDPTKPNNIQNKASRVLLHGHCYQKARPLAGDGLPIGVGACISLLEACGYQVSLIDSGCCGMAGAFGYEKEHYALSLAVGELALLPAVRSADPEVLIAASGVSCRSQILDHTQKRVYHPVELTAKLLQ